MTKEKTWTHKVVKMMRGMDGAWFSLRGTAYASEVAAREAAQRFAAEQSAAGATGHRITVRTRGGALVAEWRT